MKVRRLNSFVRKKKRKKKREREAKEENEGAERSNSNSIKERARAINPHLAFRATLYLSLVGSRQKPAAGINHAITWRL